MLFIEWQPVVGWTIAVLAVALCLVAFQWARNESIVLRRVIRWIAVLVLMVDALWIFALIDSGRSYSNPVFSPDRTMAARIVYTDMAGERDADVEVFRKHGFSHEVVYSARPLLTEKEMHWLDSKNLWLAGLDRTFCRSTDFVLTHCGAANPPAAPNGPVVINLYLIAPEAQAPSPHSDRP